MGKSCESLGVKNSEIALRRLQKKHLIGKPTGCRRCHLKNIHILKITSSSTNAAQEAPLLWLVIDQTEQGQSIGRKTDLLQRDSTFTSISARGPARLF